MSKAKQSPLRFALALAAIAVLVFGASSASAATGGASSFTAGSTNKNFAFSPWKVAGASWYGGRSLWGAKTACGQTLHRHTLGVAHKTLPCGTTVKFRYHGHVLITRVIDRGPYVKGRAWDFTSAASEVLHFEGVGRVRYAVSTSLARKNHHRR